MRRRISSVWLFLFVMTVLFGLWNFLSPYTGDDLRYHCMFANYDIDSSRLVKSMKDVIASNIVHFKYVNGRVLAHLMIQTFTGITGKLPFNILNPLFFTAYIVLICQLGLRHISWRGLLWTVGLVLFLMPNFHLEYLWMCGAVNYLWSSVFILLFLLLLRNTEGKNTKDYRWWELTLLLLFAFVTGGLHEGITVPLCVGLVIYELYIWHKKKSFDRHLLRPWLTLAFIIGALICMGSTIQRAHNQYESFMGSLQERWDCGIYIWSKLHRISHAAELFSLILIIQLADCFKLSRRIKKRVTVLFFTIIIAFYAVVLYYTCINYRQHVALTKQLESGKQIVTFQYADSPSFVNEHICRTIGMGMDDELWYLDPDIELCKVYATIYGLDYMLFMPETLYEMLNNYPDGFEEFTDCGNLPFYTKRIDKDLNIKTLFYRLREAKPEEIPFYYRPFTRFCDRYKKNKYSIIPTTLLYNNQLYLFAPKLSKDLDDRLTEITIVKEEEKSY